MGGGKLEIISTFAAVFFMKHAVVLLLTWNTRKVCNKKQ